MGDFFYIRRYALILHERLQSVIRENICGVNCQGYPELCSLSAPRACMPVRVSLRRSVPGIAFAVAATAIAIWAFGTPLAFSECRGSRQEGSCDVGDTKTVPRELINGDIKILHQ